MMSVHSFTVYDLFKRNSKFYRDKIAIVSEDQQISFGELFAQINKVVGSLTAQGIREETLLKLKSENASKLLGIA
jgi:non-ribosomal peptide synthetase component E (peptide arylation enzyme)